MIVAVVSHLPGLHLAVVHFAMIHTHSTLMRFGAVRVTMIVVANVLQRLLLGWRFNGCVRAWFWVRFADVVCGRVVRWVAILGAVYRCGWGGRVLMFHKVEFVRVSPY